MGYTLKTVPKDNKDPQGAKRDMLTLRNILNF